MDNNWEDLIDKSLFPKWNKNINGSEKKNGGYNFQSKFYEKQEDGTKKVKYIKDEEQLIKYREALLPVLHLWLMNDYINSYQLTQLVAGDSIFYKSGGDEVKRLQIPSSAVSKPFVDKQIGMPPKFNVAVGKDITVKDTEDAQPMISLIKKLITGKRD
jgi:hypothetical protein